MKQFLAIALLSALVISASAEMNLKAVTDIFTGFTTGMNYPELNPSFHNCSMAMNRTKQYANDVVVASEEEDPEAFAAAVSNFGFNFAQTVRSCGKSMRLVRTLIETIKSEIGNISQDSLTSRFLQNLMAFNMKFMSLKSNFQSGNFLATGKNIAEILKLFVFNSLEIPHRTLSEEIENFNFNSNQLNVNVVGIITGIQGFIEEANTTVVVDHYTALVNDTTTFVGLFPTLQQAIQAENFSAIVDTVTKIYKFIGIVGADSVVVKQETAAFIQRDLPLFDNEQKVAKAVESLFLDLPTTLSNIMRITNAYKTADYREVGHGSGGIYNQLRDGAIGK